MLVLRELTKLYQSDGRAIRALDGVSLSVEAGQCVAVCGPSGCGKTTLLLVAGGLLAPDSGQVEIDGRNPYAMSANQRAALRGRALGFIFQRFHLVPYLSVLDNVLAPSLAAAGAVDAHRRAEELIAHFGLTDRIRHVPAELSTGERQRTALARAMLNHPKVLLADEPTGNLDEANGRLVLEGLRDFASGGGAVLLVTHDPRVSQYADRIVHLEAGRLRDA